MSKITSAMAPLTPTLVTDLRTGEILGYQEWSTPLTRLLEYVQEETRRLFTVNTEKLYLEIANAKNLGSANSFARQRGYTSDYKHLPREVLAKSRINELILHKLVSETTSWVRNPAPDKRAPYFALKVNLGAVNAQMASLDRSGYPSLTLTWKVWDRELVFQFTVPNYILKRAVSKVTLPTVQYRRGKLVFVFAVQELPVSRKRGVLSAGVDLGRVEPFTLAITTPRGARVAHYTAPGRVKQLNNKRERLLIERAHILTKAKSYQLLGLDNKVLLTEAARKRSKITVLGHTVAQQSAAALTKKLTRHDVSILNMEDLKWVRGPKYGSKWNHSAQQDAITHSLSRVGIGTKKVSARNTSQACHKCGSPIVHNTKNRTVWCTECKTNLDRDLNASLSVSQGKSYPALYGKNGGNYSPEGQVTEQQAHSSGTKKPKAATIVTIAAFVT